MLKLKLKTKEKGKLLKKSVEAEITQGVQFENVLAAMVTTFKDKETLIEGTEPLSKSISFVDLDASLYYDSSIYIDVYPTPS
jgi:hypothetical protein